MDRRGFIGSILAACAAPAIVRADSLMRIVPREAGILLRGPAQYIDVSFSSADLVLKMDDFAERIIRREMGKLLAEQVDRAAMYSLWRSYLPTAA